MPPLGKCTRRIALVAAMVNDFGKITLRKHNFYLAFERLTDKKKLHNFKTRQGPSTNVLGATFSNPNPYATIPVEGISYFLSYQTWETGKHLKSYEARAKPKKFCGPYGPIAVKLLRTSISHSNSTQQSSPPT
jgi:hypothetical protein